MYCKFNSAYNRLIAKVQANYVQDLKRNLKHGEVFVIADFSENYTCIVQDAIQSYHWHVSQATVHPFMCYYKDSDGQLLNRCYIAESTVHDTVSVHLFQKKLITFLTVVYQAKYSMCLMGAQHNIKTERTLLTLATIWKISV